MTNEIDNELQAIDKAVMLDLHVRTGTANVLQQRQWLRYMYAGTALCECSFSIEPGKSVSDNEQYNLLILTSSGALKVAFTDADGNNHVLNIQRSIVLDSSISNIVLTNESPEAVVTVNLTKLK